MRAARLVLAPIAFTALAALTAACGSKPGKSVCENTVPPPAACMSQCDPSPSAPNTCPSGFHCAPDGFCDALCTPGGGECGDGYVCTNDGRCKGENECEGLECNITACQMQGKPETTLKGTVYAPNGTLPLYGINVYVPNAPLPPLTEGAECARCMDDLPGSPIVRAQTDHNGNFVLSGVPSGTDIPLVLSSGKWRREIKISSVPECEETTLPGTDTRLPRNSSEGNIPKIALTTGDADSMECLISKLGIDDSEITNASGAGRIHFYRGDGVQGFNGTWAGGANASLSSATELWNDANKLKAYDIVILSCEGSQQSQTSPKTQNDLNALKEYADFGGRVFASHWHNIWISGGYQNNATTPFIEDWRDIATWGSRGEPQDRTDIIDEVSNPKGVAFADWMQSPGVMGTTTRGEITPINEMRITALSLDTTKAERWTYVKATGNQEPQNFQFTTPINVPLGDRCGKVVFSDMHVSGTPNLGNNRRFPDTCNNANTFTPQEKALAFMLFDLASCVGVIL